MATLDQFEPEFRRFEELDPDDRKTAVRALEARVRAGEVLLRDAEFQTCRASPRGLPRILAYILVQEGRVPVSAALLRSNLVSEMELLRRAAFNASYSRMPLYYAARAYVERLRADPSLVAAAEGDLPLLRQIRLDLTQYAVDREGQVLPKIEEAARLIQEPRTETPHPTVAAALISRRGAVIGALIALIGTITAAVIVARSRDPGPADASSTLEVTRPAAADAAQAEPAQPDRSGRARSR